MVFLRHPPIPRPDQFATQGLRCAKCCRQCAQAAQAQLAENFQLADDLLVGRELFFDHFTAPDAHFFWCMRRAKQFDVDFAPFRHCTAYFDRMSKRPSVQKLFAFEKSVLEEFSKAAWEAETLISCAGACRRSRALGIGPSAMAANKPFCAAKILDHRSPFRVIHVAFLLEADVGFTPKGVAKLTWARLLSEV
jgi:hypothetical protein